MCWKIQKYLADITQIVKIEEYLDIIPDFNEDYVDSHYPEVEEEDFTESDRIFYNVKYIKVLIQYYQITLFL